MRYTRFVTLAVLAWLVAVGLSIAPAAQAPASDAEYDTLMKAVGATVGSMRKNMEGQTAAAVAADAKRMVELQTNNAAFWKARGAADAAEWASSAMSHAAEIEKAATAGNMAGAAEHMKQMMGTCGQCHGKYRDKDAEGNYVIKKS